MDSGFKELFQIILNIITIIFEDFVTNEEDPAFSAYALQIYIPIDIYLYIPKYTT